MNCYAASLDEIIKGLQTSAKYGISKKEAERRLKESGPNKISEGKRKSILKRFAEQLNDFMVIVLIAAAAISMAISLIDGKGDFVEPVLILAIVAVNAIIGIIQETQAEHSLEALKRLSSPKSKVLRGGIKVEIPSEEIVPGDIVFFESGDRITADARLIDDTGLRLEESSLTGESEPVDKLATASVREDAPLAERYNMVYTGSSVVGGKGTALVTATGMNTEVGKIAGLLNISQAPPTPLQKRLEGTGKILGLTALSICALIFVIGILNKSPILDSLLLSVSLAVAAVPEGLPAIVTIVLALGVKRMAKRNAIIRRLPAVETLGAATVICSDKTGTLTQNKMTVRQIIGADGSAGGSAISLKLLSYGALCTNSYIDRTGEIHGDPTENAIVTAAQERGASKLLLEKTLKRIDELPFDSRRKLMSTVHTKAEGDYLIITKGAPDVLIGRCKSIDTGNINKLTPELIRRILEENAKMANSALRIIAVAYKETYRKPFAESTDLESDLVFLGLIGLMDPPRPQARAAVANCRRAGIRPVMITGDHVITASAVARELGILKASDKTISGSELDELISTGRIREIVKYSVFARVTPEHKTEIVKALQAEGQIVAMTGDGVNDAPALKAADIGCAMGRSGTDVARGASDMILTDDDFSTIVAAIREGRGIYQNILKTVHFLLSCNIGEILLILTAFLIGRPSPLMPIQLLWINLVTDSLPALALGKEEADRDIMHKSPVNPKSGMFSGGRILDIIVQGIMIGAVSFLAYEIGARTYGFMAGRTYAFAVLGLSQLIHAFNVRSKESIFSIGLLSNKEMIFAFLICCAMQVIVICSPFLSNIFGTLPLTLVQWRDVIGFSLIPLFAVEISKISVRKKFALSSSL